MATCWIIHSNGTVEVVDLKMERIIRKFYVGRYLGNDLRNYSFFLDDDFNLWVWATDQPYGLLRLNTETGEHALFTEKELISKVVRRIIQRPDGDVWIGLDHGGISILKKTGEIQHVVNDINDPASLVSNNINTLYQDSRGIVWVGATKNGVSYYKERSGNFISYRTRNPDPSYNDITSMVEEDGKIWFGTDGGGLLLFDLAEKKLREIPVVADNTHVNVIVTILENNQSWTLAWNLSEWTPYL